MSLEITINEELKNSMKSGDKVRTETLRSIRSAIIEFSKSGVGREMNSDDEIKLLNLQAKKRKDAIDLYKQANRPELMDKEVAELAIIQEFLPKQLSEVEVVEFVKNKIAATGAQGMKDMGKVMGPTMKELAGKADGGLVQKVVKELLGA